MAVLRSLAHPASAAIAAVVTARVIRDDFMFELLVMSEGSFTLDQVIMPFVSF
jgi:hypothetical protein